jgi:alpha-tubulin suppressor-like RCC1 family protein
MSQSVQGTFAIVANDGNVFNWGYIKDIKVDSVYNTITNTNDYRFSDLSINKVYAFSNHQDALFMNGARNSRKIVRNSFCSVIIYNDNTTMAYGNDTNGIVSYVNGLHNVRDIALSNTEVIVLYTDNTVSIKSVVNSVISEISGESSIASIAVDLTSSNAYAVTTSGVVKAWGSNTYNQYDISGLTNVSKVVVGTNSVFALTSAGVIKQYGLDVFGVSASNDVSGIQDITTDSFNLIALTTSGVIKVYGTLNTYGILSAHNTASIASIAANQNNLYALTTSGVVHAWGINTQGQYDISGLTDVIEIHAGYQSAFAFKYMTTLSSSDEYAFVKSNLDMDYTNPKYNVWMDSDTVVNGTLYTTNLEGVSVDACNNITIYDDQEQDIRYVFVDYDSDLWTKISNSTLDESIVESIVTAKRTIDDEQKYIDFVNAPAKEGYSSYKKAKTLKHLYTNSSVVAWGNSAFGGDNTINHTGIVSVVGNQGAFAGLKEDGSVVCWGDRHFGGDLSDSVYGLPSGSSLSSGVKLVYSTERAFAALKTNGSVVCWGDSAYGGSLNNAVYGIQSGSVSSGVTKIFSTTRAFAAIKSDGSVVCWGDSAYAGNPSHNTYGIAVGGGSIASGVSFIFSTSRAFAALKNDGSVVCWGNAIYGGSPSHASYGIPSGTGSVSSNVEHVYSNTASFAALKDDGSVVCWGNPGYGGRVNDATYGLVAGQSISSGVVALYATDRAYLAHKDNGNVVCWGDAGHGGRISHGTYGASNPNDVSNVTFVCSSQRAFAVLSEDLKVRVWGDAAYGGSLSHSVYGLNGSNSDIVNIVSTLSAFSALKSNGSVITWGNLTQGGDHAHSLFGIKGISGEVAGLSSNNGSFAAVNKDGSIVNWGNVDMANQEWNANKEFQVTRTSASGSIALTVTQNYAVTTTYNQSLVSVTTSSSSAGSSSYSVRLNGSGSNSVVISDTVTVSNITDVSYVRIRFDTYTEGYGDEGSLFIGGILRFRGSGLSNKVQIYPASVIQDVSLNIWYSKNGSFDLNGDYVQLVIEPVRYADMSGIIDIAENDNAFVAIQNTNRQSINLNSNPIFASMSNDEKIDIWKNAVYRQDIVDTSFNITTDSSYEPTLALEKATTYKVVKPSSSAIDISGLVNFIIPTNHGELVQLQDGQVSKYFTTYGNGVYELNTSPSLWPDQNGYLYFSSQGITTTKVTTISFNGKNFTVKSGSFIAEQIASSGAPYILSVVVTSAESSAIVDISAANLSGTPITKYVIYVYTSEADASANTNVYKTVEISANQLNPNSLNATITDLSNGTPYWFNAQPYANDTAGDFDADLAVSMIPSITSVAVLESVLNSGAAHNSKVYISPSAYYLQEELPSHTTPLEATVVYGSVTNTHVELSSNNLPVQLTIDGILTNHKVVLCSLPGNDYVESRVKGNREHILLFKVYDTTNNDFIEQGFDYTFTYQFPSGVTEDRGFRAYHVDGSGNLDPVPIGHYIPTSDDRVIVPDVYANDAIVLASYPTTRIVLPFIFDLSAQAVIYGETNPGVSGDYYLSQDVGTCVLDVSSIHALLRYHDPVDGSGVDLSADLVVGGPLVESDINKLVGNSSLTITQGDYAQNVPAPSSSNLAEHFIQYIASNLFGHPQAQAPIKNDAQIMADISNNAGNPIGKQFVQGITDPDVMQYIYESLVNNVTDRFDVQDTAQYVPFPFRVDDEIVFRVRMQGHINIDQDISYPDQTLASASTLSSLFGRVTSDQDSSKFMNSSGDMYSRVWVIRIKLC